MLLLFFWQFIMFYSKAGVTLWMAQVDQHGATHLFPPSRHSSLSYSPSPALLPKPQPAARSPTCLTTSLHPPPMPLSVSSCTVRTAGDKPRQPSRFSQPWNIIRGFYGWTGFFACSFYLMDQQSLLNSPLLRKINRIFAMCNMQYKTRS